MAGRRQREQYFLAEPRDMIAGEIVPPGCYLSAVEILRRQYLAHLVDLAARGRFAGVLPIPRRASVLFGETGWLYRLRDAALTDGAAIVEAFLALFPAHLDPAAAGELRDFATAGLKDKVRDAEETWNRRLEDLRERITAINEAVAALVPSDPVQARIMLIMPIMFSVFFLFFPAGLVLYWVAQNLLSIVQQWHINRTLEAEAKAKARR